MKRALLTGGLIVAALVLGGCIMICRDDAPDRPDDAVACAAAYEPAPARVGEQVEALPAEP